MKLKKEMVLFAALTLLRPLAAFAIDSSDGCGLGWEVTDKKSFSATTTRTTTNITIPPTFGMTTGTIGCEQHTIVKNEKKILHFLDANQELVLNDASLGAGEYLQHLSDLYQLKGESADCFQRSTRSNYSKLKSSQSVGTLMQNTTYIARGCALI